MPGASVGAIGPVGSWPRPKRCPSSWTSTVRRSIRVLAGSDAGSRYQPQPAPSSSSRTSLGFIASPRSTPTEADDHDADRAQCVDVVAGGGPERTRDGQERLDLGHRERHAGGRLATVERGADGEALLRDDADRAVAAKRRVAITTSGAWRLRKVRRWRLIFHRRRRTGSIEVDPVDAIGVVGGAGLVPGGIVRRHRSNRGWGARRDVRRRIRCWDIGRRHQRRRIDVADRRRTRSPLAAIRYGHGGVLLRGRHRRFRLGVRLRRDHRLPHHRRLRLRYRRRHSHRGRRLGCRDRHRRLRLRLPPAPQSPRPPAPPSPSPPARMLRPPPAHRAPPPWSAAALDRQAVRPPRAAARSRRASPAPKEPTTRTSTPGS